MVEVFESRRVTGGTVKVNPSGLLHKGSRRSLSRKKRYLKAYAKLGTMTAAAAAVGVDRKAVAKWQEKDAEFVLAVEQAEQEYCDKITKEIDRRAFEGEPKQVGWYKGVPGGIEYVKSDRLLIELARAKIPEFRPSVDITSNETINVNVDDARAKLAAMLQSNPTLREHLMDAAGDRARRVLPTLECNVVGDTQDSDTSEEDSEGGGAPQGDARVESMSPTITPNANSEYKPVGVSPDNKEPTPVYEETQEDMSREGHTRPDDVSPEA